MHDFHELNLGNFSNTRKMQFIERTQATTLANSDLGYLFCGKWRVSAELLNMLDRTDHDINYAYENRVSPTAASSFTNVFHPMEPIQVRFWLRRTY